MIRYLIFHIAFLITTAISAQEQLKDIEKFVSALDEKIPSALQDFSVPGAAIAIIENGEVVLQKGYGYADIEKGIKVSTKTGFNIASISKTVAAWGVMKLVQEEKIELDAPAERYLSRWHLPKSEYDSDEVTIRRLLSHTAGLSLHGYPGWNPGDEMPSIEQSLNGRNNGPGPVEIIMEPGTKYKYSGGGFTILQLIIEEVSGQKFEDYMQEQILNPLGMYDSSFKIDEKIMGASASEYDNFSEITGFELFTAQAAAGLHTTIEDFTRFAFASLYKNKRQKKHNPILSAQLIEQMMEPAPATNGRYGLGYEIKTRDIEKGLRGHGGSNTGWQALFFVDPDTDGGFILFTNGGAGWNIGNLLFCECIAWRTGEWPHNNCSEKIPIGNILKRTIDKNGITEIKATYESLKSEHDDKYNFSESQLNSLGYHYLAREELEKAISIFKLNVEAFPYAWNVYDSYGEALLQDGSRKEAIENYEHSIRLNPDNIGGKSILKTLGVPVKDLTMKIPVEHLEKLEGEYIATSGPYKKIVYGLENGGLVRIYQERNDKVRLVPIGHNEFVYLGMGIRVIFDTTDLNAIILTTPDGQEFKKVN